MSNIYIGSARHTIALTSLEIGCIIESIAEMIDWESGDYPMREERMRSLHHKMRKYYDLVIAAERRDLEEELELDQPDPQTTDKDDSQE